MACISADVEFGVGELTAILGFSVMKDLIVLTNFCRRSGERIASMTATDFSWNAARRPWRPLERFAIEEIKTVYVSTVVDD